VQFQRKPAFEKAARGRFDRQTEGTGKSMTKHVLLS
jgi:hypothetical protein